MIFMKHKPAWTGLDPMITASLQFTPYGVNCKSKEGETMLYPHIRALRESAGLSQAELAAKLNMHTTTYARYEQGERDLPAQIAIQIAKFHCVSLDYLLDQSPQK